jgi:predicted DCC family thiol-disulfide oxidoreductase YuxK
MSASVPTTAAATTEEPAIVYFDGVCGICNWTVDFILRRDPQRRFRFAPLQGQTSAERVKLSPEALLQSIVYEDATGQFRKSAAVWRILVRLGGVWALLGRLLWIIPLPLRDLAYGLVSRNRYSIFGRKDACRVPSKEERAMFLP